MVLVACHTILAQTHSFSHSFLSSGTISIMYVQKTAVKYSKYRGYSRMKSSRATSKSGSWFYNKKDTCWNNHPLRSYTSMELNLFLDRLNTTSRPALSRVEWISIKNSQSMSAMYGVTIDVFESLWMNTRRSCGERTTVHRQTSASVTATGSQL